MRQKPLAHQATRKVPDSSTDERDRGLLANLLQAKTAADLSVLRKPERVEIPDGIAEQFGESELPDESIPQEFANGERCPDNVIGISRG